MEEVKMKKGKPLQIIEFQMNAANKKELVLNKENLESILRNVEDMPIAFISITGASRQGKSFLLSFMIRYLEALKIDESDWMGWDNKQEALVGFKWRDGIDPETSGMWLWSEPFIVESNDEKIAILLMDTQGTFDSYTTQREWSTIVGLSMLMSSCMIFNCQQNVQEDVLTTLETYMQYGMQALQQSGIEDQCPFQKLMFLIRDWSMLSTYPYGSKGGAQFLAEKLKIKENQSIPAKRVRESIKNCFESVECFLMPDPGEKAKEGDFNGALSQLSTQFAKKIEAFVTDFLNPDDVVKKTVFGVEFKGLDLLTYFDKYVEIFNGDELPEPISIFNATAQLSNQSVIQRSKKIYLENMKKKQRGQHIFVSDKKFAAFHGESEKKAANAFEKEKLLGSDELQSLVKENFFEEISKEFKILQMQNKTKREKEMAKAEESGIQKYKEYVEDELSENFYEDKKLIGKSETFINDIMDEAEQKIEEEDEQLQKKFLTALKTKLEDEQKTFIEKNKLKRAEAEEFMNTLVENITSEHSYELDEELKKNETLEEDEINHLNKDILKKSLDKFSDAEKKGDRNFIGNYKKILEEKLENKREKLITVYLDTQQQKRLKAEKLINELVTDFEKTLILEAENVDNEEDLKEKQKEYEKEAEKSFQANHEFASTNEIVAKLGEDLKLKLAAVFETEVLEKYHSKQKENEESFEKAFNKSLVSYIEEMATFVETCEYHHADALKAQHSIAEKNALDLYNGSPKFGKNIEEKTREMEERLKKEMENAFKKTLEENDLKKSNLEHKSQNDVTECVKEYQKEMKTALESARNEEKLKEFHKTALNNAKSLFKTKCTIKTDAEFVETYCKRIEEEVEETFEEILELYQLKAEEQSVGTEKALMEAKRFYHEEMAKHVSQTRFMRPRDLEKLHVDVSKKSIDRCCDLAPLTALQKEDLEASLKITYRKYEEANDMNIPIDPAIGIDLGTTYSCVAVYYKGSIEVISNKQGKKTTPSYVAFKDGIEIIGEAAKNQAHENPENTIFDAKRIIGRRMDDEKLQADIKLWPFKVVEEGGIPKIEAEGKTYYPEQISAKILQEMRVNAEQFLGGCHITRAVITVPAYFTDGQRAATIDAGKIAGLDTVKIIDEPTAAAIAYKLQYMDDESRNILIFDLGGGTFDVAVLEMRKGVIEVKAKDGDTHLGGEDFDNNLVEHCALEFQASIGVDFLEGKDSTVLANRRKCLKAIRRVKNESERRKIDLAAAKAVNIVVDSIDSGHDLKVPVTRDEFESMNQELFQKTITIVEKVLKSAGKDKSEIDDIVLVGGSTRIPKIQELLTNYFGGKALSKKINPDEAVAVGAAIQAAIWNGEIAKESKDFNTILDITPFPLGVEVYGGDFSIIIPKNNRIPCQVEDTYRTAHNNQTSVQIVVYQGENKKAVDNTLLGEFYLNGIPPADAGREVVKVIMTINEQGVLEIKATCSSNGVSNTGLPINEQRWRLGADKIKRILGEGK